MPNLFNDKIEVHVGIICFRIGEDGILEVLLGQRADSAPDHAGLWETGGGPLLTGEDFITAAERKLSEQFGVQARILEPVVAYRLTGANSLPIPGIKFACLFERYTRGTEPALDPEIFSHYRWQRVDQLDALELLPGEPTDTHQDILTAAGLFGTNQSDENVD